MICNCHFIECQPPCKAGEKCDRSTLLCFYEGKYTCLYYSIIIANLHMSSFKLTENHCHPPINVKYNIYKSVQILQSLFT